MRIGELKSVVVGVTNGRCLVLNTAVLRERTEKLLTRNQSILQLATARCELSSERVGDQLVESSGPHREELRIEHVPLVTTRGEFDTPIAYVRDIKQIIRADGILEAEHPLLKISRRPGASNSRYALADILQCAERVAERLENSARHWIAQSIEGDEVLSASDRRGLRISVRRSVACIRWNEEDSIAAAHDEFVGDTIANSETRSEVAVRGVVEAPAVRRSVEDQLSRSGETGSGSDRVERGEVKILLLVMTLSKRRLNLIPDSSVDGEAWSRFPVVLYVSAEIVLLGCKLSVDAGGAVVVGNAQQERGKALASSLRFVRRDPVPQLSRWGS